MIGKRKYVILGVLVIILFISAYIITSELFDNKEGLSDKDNIVQGQTLEYDQLEEEGSEVEKNVSQDAEKFSSGILGSDIDRNDSIRDQDKNESGKDEKNINHEDEYVDDLNGNEDDNGHKDSLQPSEDTNNEYGPIN